MNTDTRMEGLVSALQRTTHVSGGAGDTSVTTQHVAIFDLSGQRVLLMGKEPPMISDGDRVRVVGQCAPGQFTAIACKNISTGWATTHKAQGCAAMALIGVILLSIALCVVVPVCFFVPLLFLYLLMRLLRYDDRIKKAHLLLEA